MRETATGGVRADQSSPEARFLARRWPGRDTGGRRVSAMGAAGEGGRWHHRAGWDQALLEFRRRRQPKMGAHRLFGAVKAIQPGAVIMDDAAALDARQHFVACLGLGARRARRIAPHSNTGMVFFMVTSLAPELFRIGSGPCSGARV